MSSGNRFFRASFYVIALLFLALGTQAQVTRAAGPWYVNGTTGSDTNDCLSPTVGGGTVGPCATIGGALAKASAGDIVNVAAGTYATPTGISQGVTLRGPQWETSPNPNGGPRSGGEAIIMAPNPAIRVSTTQTVIIEGFTFETPSISIDSYTADSNITIQKNIFQNVPGQMTFFNAPDLLTVIDNYFFNIGTGGEETLFVSGDYNGASGTVIDVSDNTWSNSATLALNLSNTSGSITDNRFINIDLGALPANNSGLTFSGNLFDCDLRANSTGIAIFTPSISGTLNIADNQFLDCTNAGVRFSTFNNPAVTGQDINVNFNSFVGNADGIRIPPEVSYTDGMNAENNWWGCNEGPGNAGCDDVVQHVSGIVDANPWLVLTASSVPSAINPGGNAVVSGEITSNSDGVDAGGSTPDGTTIGFASLLGTFDNATATTVNGVASSNFTAGATTGSDVANVTADNETVSTLDIVAEGVVLPPDDDDDDDDGGSAAAPAQPGQPARTFDCSDLGVQTNGAMSASGTAGNVAANGLTGNVFCHVIALNGAYVTNPGEIGKPEVISQGVVQAVDLFGLLPGGIGVKPFVSPVGLCLAGVGNVFFLNAEDRAVTQLPASSNGAGSTCVMVPASGTVILTGTYTPGSTANNAPAASAPASNGTSTPLTDCQVTTDFLLRLREDASTSSDILARLPMGTTLDTTEAVDGWYRVVYGDQQGWVSADFVSTSGDCG